MNSEILFLVETAQEGGYLARAIDYDIFTEADTIEEIREMVKDAVACHFESQNRPKLIRLHIVADEVILR